MSQRVAFVTYQSMPDLNVDDQLVVEILQKQNIEAVPVIWTDPSVDWSEFDLTIIRSTWDYHHRPDDFKRWLNNLRHQTRLLNPAKLIQWNMSKFYLEALAKKGITIVPTKWIRKGTFEPSLVTELQSNGWVEAIVKPVVSASAYHTWRTSIHTAKQDTLQFRKDVAARDTMLQMFVPAIQQGGEWSFIFFNRKFSHAVLKTPKDGDFRVQEEYGGKTEPAKPSADFVQQAKTIANAIPGDWLYARIDVVDMRGELVLMELELIEPSLYLDKHPQAPQNFADAIKKRLSMLTQS